MTFEDRLKEYHHGKITGAAARLAGKLKINPGTVSRWVNEGIAPNKDLRTIVAEELGITVEQLMACFPARDRGASRTAEPATKFIQSAAAEQRRIPFFGSVCAGGTNFSFDAIPEYTDPPAPAD